MATVEKPPINSLVEMYGVACFWEGRVNTLRCEEKYYNDTIEKRDAARAALLAAICDLESRLDKEKVRADAAESMVKELQDSWREHMKGAYGDR